MIDSIKVNRCVTAKFFPTIIAVPLLLILVSNAAITPIYESAYAVEEFDIDVGIEDYEINRGDTQHITATVFNDDTDNHVSEADVKLTVYPPDSDSTSANDETDNDGEATFDVEIDDNAETGTYDVDVRVSKDGYDTKTVSTSFDVVGSNNNDDDDDNDDSYNGDNDHNGSSSSAAAAASSGNSDDGSAASSASSSNNDNNDDHSGSSSSSSAVAVGDAAAAAAAASGASSAAAAAAGDGEQPLHQQEMMPRQLRQRLYPRMEDLHQLRQQQLMQQQQQQQPQLLSVATKMRTTHPRQLLLLVSMRRTKPHSFTNPIFSLNIFIIDD